MIVIWAAKVARFRKLEQKAEQAASPNCRSVREFRNCDAKTVCNFGSTSSGTWIYCSAMTWEYTSPYCFLWLDSYRCICHRFFLGDRMCYALFVFTFLPL